MHIILKHTRDGEPFETVPYGNAAVARISELAGRNIGTYILMTALPYGLRRHGREGAYVAAGREGAYRASYPAEGGGFHVEVIR